MGIAVTELICPQCKSPLDGLDTDTVFVCLPCSIGVDIENGVLEKVPLNFAPVGMPTTLPVVYLPIWRMDVSVDVVDEQGRTITDKTIVNDLDTVWVCAFYEVRPSYLGNPGFDLTDGKVSLLGDMEPPSSAKVVGSARNKTEAKRYAQVFVTQMLDVRKDVTGIDIQVRVGNTELWALPFSYNEETRQLTELNSGKSYPAAIVENLTEIENL